MPDPKPPTRTSHRPPATIRQVAALAGVSVAAVSRYVNAKQRFTPEVERRIAQAIAEVGYQGNPIARSMVTGRTGAVAALVAEVERPHTASLIKGFSRAALESGHDLLIVDMAGGETVGSGDTDIVGLDIDRVLGLQVDGLLIAAPTPAGTAERLVRYGRPFVDFARDLGADAAFEQAGAMLGQYFVRTGHRRLAYLGCDDEVGSAAIARGLGQGAADGGMALQVHRLVRATAEAGADVASSLLMAMSAPDAVVACNDRVAMGLLDEARRLSVAVPGELSVAAVGDSMPARYLWPALTCVDLHTEARAARALSELLAAIRGEAFEAPPASPVRLVVRGSTRQRGAPEIQ